MSYGFYSNIGCSPCPEADFILLSLTIISRVVVFSNTIFTCICQNRTRGMINPMQNRATPNLMQACQSKLLVPWMSCLISSTSKIAIITRASRIVKTRQVRKRMKNLRLEKPTQLLIQGQWWSMLRTHCLHREQWWLRQGLKLWQMRQNLRSLGSLLQRGQYRGTLPGLDHTTARQLQKLRRKKMVTKMLSSDNSFDQSLSANSKRKARQMTGSEMNTPRQFGLEQVNSLQDLHYTILYKEEKVNGNDLQRINRNEENATLKRIIILIVKMN